MALEAVGNEREHGPSLVSSAALRLSVHSFNMRLSGPGAYPALAVFGKASDRVVEAEVRQGAARRTTT